MSIRIVGISGSLRQASKNSGLLRYAQKVAPAGTTVEIVGIGNLPLHNQDLEADFPKAVAEFKEKIASADAIVITCPENNYSMSAALKNALDWGTRGPGGNVWKGKPAGVFGGGGGTGTAKAQMHFRDVAQILDLHVMNSPELNVKFFVQPAPCDNETGDVVDETTQGRIKDFMEALGKWANVIRKGSQA
eukprot:TRINITY_DN102932_c0_g1_i1.p3 TRINITY_DN102932_c0_g1~~TRINITY_DN102932_c0_g1_i1.p3  ORF type:complete len:216 (+),score=45.14 TRINITY_DN102932_c0_g1_i1:81-650(+)